MDLKPEVKQALIDMNFVEQFKKLSEDYAADVVPYNERIDDSNVDRIIQAVKRLGYSATYNKREHFFVIVFKDSSVASLNFRLHLSLRDGFVELIWGVMYNGEVLLGDPLSYVSMLIDEKASVIPFPAVLSYEELEEVLKINFDMFKQFQNLLITHYEQEEKQ
ncbi:hypothetical protein ACVR0S_09705 [Streptococcus dentapri]|uniref:Uncharacterized protein n=1 Tax=Streptococcus dentapri TaxID=573564 RepID=A0ABV8D298_9STRE